jgi:DNA polymerase III subunit alpha
VEDAAVAVKGRVNWREDKMSVFGSGLIPLEFSEADLSAAAEEEETPFVLLCNPVKLNDEVVGELKNTLTAHRGDTPVHLRFAHKENGVTLALDDYPIKVTPAFLGEIKAIPGVTVDA